MAELIGFSCVLSRNTGTYASPTWAVVENVKDATLKLEGSAADASTRNSRIREYLPGMLDVGLDFASNWNPADADFAAFLDAYTGSTGLELLVLDGPSATAGSEGIRAKFLVESATRNEPLGETVTADFVCKPMINTDAAPAWYTASS